jgi:hypothetical protein
MRTIRTLKLELAIDDFEEIAAAIEAGEFKMMARGYGSDDDDYVETLPEDRDPDVFFPEDYVWQIWP